MTFLCEVKKKWRWFKYLRKWKKNNAHNFTTPLRGIPFTCVQIGKGTYGKINAFNCTKESKLVIGNYCSIADEVSFLLSVDHPLDRLSTYPFRTMYGFDGYVDATSKGDIVVDDDVWIGYRSTIMSGVHIGRGAVVAAGAVVTRDVPPYSIVGGVPAKVIKYRFKQEIVAELMKFDFGKTSVDAMKKASCCKILDEKDVCSLLKRCNK